MPRLTKTSPDGYFVMTGVLYLAGFAVVVVLFIQRTRDYMKLRRKVRPIEWNGADGEHDDEPRA